MKNKQYSKLEELKHKYNLEKEIANAEIIENWVTEWIKNDPIGYILRNY